MRPLGSPRRTPPIVLGRVTVRFGQVLGPFLGGVLIAAIGAANVLFVDAGTFCLSAAAVAVGVPRDVGASTPARAGRRRYFAELAEGLRFVRSKPFLLSMVLVATIGNALDKPLVTVIAPVYAKRIYGSPTSLGVLVGAFGAGALVGSLLFAAIGRDWSRRRTFLSCYVIGPLLIFGTLALQPPLGIAIVAALAAGLAFGPVNPIFATVTQEHTPPQLLGRVFGALTALASAGVPIGAALVGVVVQSAGLIPTIVGMGLVYVAVNLGMFLNPALRGMDAPRPCCGSPAPGAPPVGPRGTCAKRRRPLMEAERRDLDVADIARRANVPADSFLLEFASPASRPLNARVQRWVRGGAQLATPPPSARPARRRWPPPQPALPG
jgi:hypothetical protein